MNYEEMRKMEKTHVCAQCGGVLVTIWDRDEDTYKLVCGSNRGHQNFQRTLSAAEKVARGEADKEFGLGAQKDLEDLAARGALQVSRLPTTDIATRRLLDPKMVQGLIIWAENLGLKAYLGHACLYFSNPYVTIDGFYYLNQKREKPYHIGTRPMTNEEKIAYMIEEATYAFIAEGWLCGEKLVETGCGYVTKEEIERESERHPGEFRAPVAHSHPQRMAEKRAEWQLLRKLIPLEEKE